MVLYLLDANILIDANRDYYPIGRVDEYWGWLVHPGKRGRVKVPIEVWEEVRDGKDALAAWAKDSETNAALRFGEEVNVALVQRVLAEGYAPDLNDVEVETIGRDPFLIAHALAGPDRWVVTSEVSKPKKQRENRRVPDVCATLGVPSCNAFAFTRALDFRTGWQSDQGSLF